MSRLTPQLSRRAPRIMLRLLTTCFICIGMTAYGQIDESLTKRLGAGYAAMINFAENPDIATARYYIDSDSGADPTLRVTRYGGEHAFGQESRKYRPFIGLHVPYLRYGATLEFGDNASIKTRWTAAGAVVMTGLELAATTNLTIKPALACGYVQLKNDGDYSGDAVLLQPLLDGVLFNWASDAWIFGGALGADYTHAIGLKTLDLHAAVSHNLIETFQNPRGSVEFSSYATTFNLRGEVTHPTDLALAGSPLSMITLMGATTFAGPYRDELGFEYFIDAGLALEADLSQRDWILSRLRLGLKGIWGEDVIGWSAILSWKF